MKYRTVKIRVDGKEIFKSDNILEGNLAETLFLNGDFELDINTETIEDAENKQNLKTEIRGIVKEVLEDMEFIGKIG